MSKSFCTKNFNYRVLAEIEKQQWDDEKLRDSGEKKGLGLFGF